MVVQYVNFIKLFVAAKEKWSGFYHDFNEVLKTIESDTWIHKIQNVSTERKDIIYKIITKRSYGGFYRIMM